MITLCSSQDTCLFKISLESLEKALEEKYLKVFCDDY